MKQRVVVAALVQREGKYLFGRQNGGFSPGKLIIPGGGIDAGEHPEEALRREFREEANIELQNVQLAHCDSYTGPYKGEPYHLIFLQFTADYASGEPQAGDDVTELMWLAQEEILAHPQNDATTKFLKAIGMV